jgi:hypothetical protein
VSNVSFRPKVDLRPSALLRSDTPYRLTEYQRHKRGVEVPWPQSLAPAGESDPVDSQEFAMAIRRKIGGRL